MPKAPRKNFGIKSQRWTFTINNYTDEDIELIKKAECKSIIAGFEIGEKCGTPHIQGGIFFTKQVRINHLKEVLGPRGHYEKMKKPWQNTVNYCRKEGNLLRDEGNGPSQGKRNDIAAFRDAIREGIDIDEAWSEFPGLMARYPRMYNSVRDAGRKKLKRNWMTKGIWIWGETHTGKSHKIFEEMCDGSEYIHEVKDKGWWDDYEGEETVVLDDFRGQIEYCELLRLIDKWPKKVSRRGLPPTPFLAKRVIISSSMPPEKAYPRQNEKEDSIAQLLRRVEVIELKGRNEDAAADASAKRIKSL